MERQVLQVKGSMVRAHVLVLFRALVLVLFRALVESASPCLL